MHSNIGRLLSSRKQALETPLSSTLLKLRPAAQVAYTIVSQTIFSQLGYYKALYGPSILLLLNIFYFLPSIPLLALSSFCDEYLDRNIGKARQLQGPLLLTPLRLAACVVYKCLHTAPACLADLE